MKRIAFILAALLVSTSMMAQKADKKKKKTSKSEAAPIEAVAQPVPEPAPVVLLTKADSVNYAAGMSFTRGLIDYLVVSMKADTTFIDAFIEGYLEAQANGASPAFKMKALGEQIEMQVERQFLPSFMQQAQDIDVDLDVKKIHEGFLAGVKGDYSLMKVDEAGTFVDDLVRREKMARQLTNMKNGRAFLEENAKKEGVVTTESGLQYKVLVQGDGRIPVASDVVKVKYEGRLIDGTVFDSSYERDPDYTSFKCSSLIKGWVEALTMMPVGSKWELYIPYDLAYGDRDSATIPGYSTLIFTMELLDIQDPPAPRKKD